MAEQRVSYLMPHHLHQPFPLSRAPSRDQFPHRLSEPCLKLPDLKKKGEQMVKLHSRKKVLFFFSPGSQPETPRLGESTHLLFLPSVLSLFSLRNHRML